MKCEIQWVDDNGPTPDDNEAVALVYLEAHEIPGPHGKQMAPRSKDYPICAKHMERMIHGTQRENWTWRVARYLDG